MYTVCFRYETTMCVLVVEAFPLTCRIELGRFQICIAKDSIITMQLLNDNLMLWSAQ